MIITHRPRRNRKSAAIRSLLAETSLESRHLVAPFFVMEGHKLAVPINSMPGVYRYSIDTLLKAVEEHAKAGIQAINLFCYVTDHEKDEKGSVATKKGSILQRAISAVKQAFPDMAVCADIALDPFTSHGHDGIVKDGKILNDPTIEVLCEMALRAAEAGADVVSPSDMMDGRVGCIREALDKAAHTEVSILSYAVKYASSLYAPFREALNSAPQFGDKKSYQLDPANSRQARIECLLDEQEGADMLLIKPALTSLDIIAAARKESCLPIGAYQVSGEYAMIKAAALQGWIDEEKVLYETLLSIKRAGADFIFTYAAKQIALLLG